MIRLVRSLAPCAVLGSFLAACSGGGGGGGGGSSSFSGTILGPSATGLQGALVQVKSAVKTAEAVTDANGNFIVLKPPTGLVALHIDGSNVPGGTFASLELALVVGGGATNLPQPVVLPDLAAGATLSVPLDANGQTAGVMTLTAPDGSALTIPDMTTILVHGAIPAGPVDVNITPVPAINVPMPLPGQQDAGAFVTIQPPGASFDPPLDITLPNTRGFPLGTLVDIWSFDHDAGAWVNRSEETGHQGTVVDIGGNQFIVATGVITEGGWHAGSLPVDPTCATTIEGQVFALGAPTPLEDVLISLSTGQFAHTDASGRFSIASVPAYDASMLPKNCLASEVELRVIAPVALGSGQVTLALAAGAIVSGGRTTLADLAVPVTDTGSLVGSATDHGRGVAGTVSLTGTSELDLETGESGAFFVAALEPGPYTASFPFEGGVKTVAFTIAAHRTKVVALQAAPPPSGPLSVLVLDFTAGNGTPVPGAFVTLEGASGGRQFEITGADGKANFSRPPGGPYTLTAQRDTLFPASLGRQAASLVGVDPAESPRLVALPFFDDGGFGAPSTVDAALHGNVLNPPLGVDLQFQIVTDSSGGFGTGTVTFLGTSFQSDVPSGVPLDVAVWATDALSGAIVSAVFASGVTVGSGQTLAREFDFAEACPFDQPVSAGYANVPPQGELFAELELRGSGRLVFSFSDGGSLPPGFGWPDLEGAKLAGFAPFFAAGAVEFTPGFARSSCELPLGHATPSSLAVEFLGFPSLESPADMAVLPSFGTGSIVRYAAGSGNGTAGGFDSIAFAGESESGGLATSWNILVPASTTTFTLPAVFPGKPMFPDGFYAADVELTRFEFPGGFAFATAFDEDLPGVVAALESIEVCRGRRSSLFVVGSAPTAHAGGRAGLERRASSAHRPGAR